MPDMSPFLTVSIMKIMLQARNVHSSSRPALTHPHSVLLSSYCLHALQMRRREQCPMLLTMGKKITKFKSLQVFGKKKNTNNTKHQNNPHCVFPFAGSVKIPGQQSWMKFLIPFLIYCIDTDRHAKRLKMLTYSYTFRTWVTFWSS